ncbi:imidazole glycerol phosphate synthase subunit HisH [Humibacter ginsengisoli]
MTNGPADGSSPTVVVLDYGSGNVHSAAKALEAVGADVTLTSDRHAAMAADGLVVPGVGAFKAVVDQLRAVHGAEIIDRRLAGGRPVLGICVGMQVLFECGVEHGHDAEGLGEWPGTVERLESGVLPHMGWNTVDAPVDSVLFDGVRDERFYFVHSYAAQRWELEPSGRFQAAKLTWADHGGRFVAAVENGPLSATQFHPEKSGRAGMRLLSNWVQSLPVLAA